MAEDDVPCDYNEFIKKAQKAIDKLLYKKCPAVCLEKKRKILLKMINLEFELGFSHDGQKHKK